MKKYQTIQDLFKDWGINEQKIPENNLEIKNKILEKFPYGKINVSIKTPLPWLSFAFVTIAVLLVIGNSINYQTKAYNYQTDGLPAINGSATKSSDLAAPNYYRENAGLTAPISDNREFLKTEYSATLQTRDIASLKTRIETIVRGFGGRVDGSSGDKRYGYVNFAIPAEQLLAFKQEVKSLVGSKLYIEQISSENLLPQKQIIEREQSQTQRTLDDAKNERIQLSKDHNKNIDSFQSRIDTLSREVSSLEKEWQTATPQRKTEITPRISELQTEINILQDQLAEENNTYQNKLNNLNAQIKNAEVNLEMLNEQDLNLVQNVATVNGSITLKWISLWEMADIYTPGPLIAWIFLVAAVVSYFWYRRSVELVI